jgi:hypothetical protein
MPYDVHFSMLRTWIKDNLLSHSGMYVSTKIKVGQTERVNGKQNFNNS